MHKGNTDQALNKGNTEKALNLPKDSALIGIKYWISPNALFTKYVPI